MDRYQYLQHLSLWTADELLINGRAEHRTSIIEEYVYIQVLLKEISMITRYYTR